MISVHPHFITDDKGKKIFVVLPMKEYKNIMERLDDLNIIKLYDEAKNEDDGERVFFSDYLNGRNSKNA